MNGGQEKTPLFDAMVALAESKKLSFHTPGHKSGKGISTRFRMFVGHNIFSIDLTTLDEVDSLQNPRGVIKEAQELAARAYGADSTHFLINGTSGGNHAMLLATCKKGDKILLPKNVHRSVLAGVILAGAEPVMFHTKTDPQLGLDLNVDFDSASKVIEENPDAKILFLSSPNYYGITADLQPIIKLAHEKGMIVLVDEAHGPHLKFHKDLPVNALSAGADIVVQSTHKIIGGMTQASMLHIKSELVDVEFLGSVMRLLRTTSPSYILMASLDLARMQMATEGEQLLGRTLRLARRAREKINRIAGLKCFGDDMIKQKMIDITKLTINVSKLGYSGYEVSKILNKSYGIQVEMADLENILIILSIGDNSEDVERLMCSLEEMAAEAKNKTLREPAITRLIPSDISGKQVVSPEEAFLAPREYVPIGRAAERISSETLTVYPPGVAILIPGELITRPVVEYITHIQSRGGTVDGLDSTNKLAAVIK